MNLVASESRLYPSLMPLPFFLVMLSSNDTAPLDQ